MRIEYHPNGLIDCIKHTGNYTQFDYQLSDNNIDQMLWRISHFKYDTGYTHYHKEDGPAIIIYNKNGNIESQYYFLNDKTASKQEVLLLQLNKELKEHDLVIDNYLNIHDITRGIIVARCTEDTLEENIKNLIGE